MLTFMQIRHAGLWDKSVMTKAYLPSLPPKFIREAAGFRTREDHYLPRVQVTPPASLVEQVWPQVPTWLRRFEKHTSENANFTSGGVDNNDLAAQGFLNLLASLRPIFLQDCAILRAKFPGHSLWNVPPFNHPDWGPFADAVLQAEKTVKDSVDIASRSNIAQLAEWFATSETAFTVNQTASFLRLESKMNSMLTFISNLTGGRIALFLQRVPCWSPGAPPPQTPGRAHWQSPIIR